MNELETQYLALKTELQDDTRIHSNPNMWLRHKAYKAIVALGQAVVPLIIADLKKHEDTKRHEDYPGWWAMYALPDITGTRIKVGGPEVKHEDGFNKVDVGAVSRFWIAYGKERGMIT